MAGERPIDDTHTIFCTHTHIHTYTFTIHHPPHIHTHTLMHPYTHTGRSPGSFVVTWQTGLLPAGTCPRSAFVVVRVVFFFGVTIDERLAFAYGTCL